MGSLGAEQLAWLEDDVKHLSRSTPVVVFAHMPLWNIYPEWGWGTDDSAQALSYLKALRLGDRSQRTHSSNHAEGGRQRLLPHGNFYCLPATSSGSGSLSRSHEGTRGTVARTSRNYRRDLHTQASLFSVDRFLVWSSRSPNIRKSTQTRKEQAMKRVSWISCVATLVVFALATLLTSKKADSRGPAARGGQDR